MHATESKDRKRVRPLVALTMGDPAGIGPEIIAKAYQSPRLWAAARPFVVGNSLVLRDALARYAPGVEFRTIRESDVARESAFASDDSPPDSPPLLFCLPLEEPLAICPAGIPSAASGRQSYDAIVIATRLALAGQVAGIVTGPISKYAWHMAGITLPGHTELLAELCGVRDSSMMLYLPPLPAHPQGIGIVHVTLHVALRDALRQLDGEGIVRTGKLLDDLMRKLRGSRPADASPRLGVCALNPHAGEQGLFGDEEATIIAPAVERLRAGGCDVVGPLPADALLARAFRGDYDGIVAMYHDQGHIAMKLLHMFDAVNITLGLPMIRTSVAHGTGFDIAGRGQADCSGLLAAVEACVALG